MTYNHIRIIHFKDTDAAGVVYFANILSICHEAYEASLAASNINLKAFFSNPDVAIPIVHASVDFFRPLFCGDRAIVQLSPRQLSDNKFEISYQIFVSKITEKSVAQALTKHVCIAPVSRTKQPLPPDLLQWMLQWGSPQSGQLIN